MHLLPLPTEISSTSEAISQIHNDFRAAFLKDNLKSLTALCQVKAVLSQHHQHRYPFTTETQQRTAKILVKCFTCSKPA